MNSFGFLSPWVKKFLLEYAVSTRNLSRNTQLSYRDTLKLLLPFIAKESKKSIDKLVVTDISPERLRIFLLELESKRGCSQATRNQRLAAIHAFAQFVGLNSPEHAEWCRQIRLIPFKKAQQSLISYLEKSEIDALLNAPNRKKSQGQRDYVILLFLYNTGARADEVAQLTVADLNLSNTPKKDFSFVLIKGKGNKLRRCPLWEQTVKELLPLIDNREQTEHFFLNRYNQPITRFGIYELVRRYQLVASFHEKNSFIKQQVM